MQLTAEGVLQKKIQKTAIGTIQNKKTKNAKKTKPSFLLLVYCLRSKFTFSTCFVSMQLDLVNSSPTLASSKVNETYSDLGQRKDLLPFSTSGACSQYPWRAPPFLCPSDFSARLRQSTTSPNTCLLTD